MQKHLLTLLLIVLGISVKAQDYPSFEKQVYVNGTDTLRYRIQYPLNYEANKKYPLILFLHGSGERGRDNEKQLVWGGALFSDEANRAKFPAIIIVPQCPQNDSWGRISRTNTAPPDSLGNLKYMSDQPIGKSLRLVSELLDSMVSAKKVIPKKVYVGGLSMGGMGTFEILWRKPGFFAAAFPICGGGDPSKVGLYGKKLPIWIFHGEKDPVVMPANSRRMVTALQGVKAKVKYSEYPGVQHDSWKNAFAEPELLKWLFQQKRK